MATQTTTFFLDWSSIEREEIVPISVHLLEVLLSTTDLLRLSSLMSENIVEGTFILKSKILFKTETAGVLFRLETSDHKLPFDTALMLLSV